MDRLLTTILWVTDPTASRHTVLPICPLYSEDSWARSVDNKRRQLIKRIVQQIFSNKFALNSASTTNSKRESAKSARD